MGAPYPHQTARRPQRASRSATRRWTPSTSRAMLSIQNGTIRSHPDRTSDAVDFGGRLIVTPRSMTPAASGPVRQALPEGNQNRARAGQSQCPRPRLTPRSLSRAEARRRIVRFAWHDTPCHGGWLDLAETEPRVLSGQCRSRHIPGKRSCIDAVAAREDDHNKHHATADQQFHTADARVRRKRLRPARCARRETSHSPLVQTLDNCRDFAGMPGSNLVDGACGAQQAMP